MKCSRHLLVAFFLTALPIAVQSTLLGAVYYASPTGGGTCSASSPCALTIALDKVAPGDEVVLLDGVYNEPLYVFKGGAAGAPVVIRAANLHQAIIRKNNDRLARILASYVTVSGIQFDGQKSGGNRGAVRVGPGDEVYSIATPIHHVVLEKLWVHHTRAAGICITSGEHDVVVKDSLVENTGYYEFWGEAFYLGNKTDSSKTIYNIEIFGNTVRGFTENGAECKKFSRDVSIHHNRFYNQVLWADYGGDASLGNDGTITIDGHNNTVFDNTLYNNKCGMAVFVIEPEAGHKVYNNVIYDGVGPGSNAIRMKNWSKSWPTGQYPPSQVYNNTFYNLVNHTVGTLDPSILIIRNNVGIDNLAGNLSNVVCFGQIFVDCGSGDFRLVAGSSPIDKAVSGPYSTVDFNGRAAVGTRDSGAFEFYSATPTPPRPPDGLRVIQITS